jgi:hypothetical protein
MSKLSLSCPKTQERLCIQWIASVFELSASESHQNGELAALDGPDSTGCAGFAGLRQRGTGRIRGQYRGSVRARCSKFTVTGWNYSDNRRVWNRAHPAKVTLFCREHEEKGRGAMALVTKDVGERSGSQMVLLDNR